MLWNVNKQVLQSQPEQSKCTNVKCSPKWSQWVRQVYSVYNISERFDTCKWRELHKLQVKTSARGPVPGWHGMHRVCRFVDQMWIGSLEELHCKPWVTFSDTSHVSRTRLWKKMYADSIHMCNQLHLYLECRQGMWFLSHISQNITRV